MNCIPLRMLRLTLLSLAGLVIVTGCTSPPPKGETGGRVSPYATTRGERHSNLPLPAAMLEFSDEVAQRLAQDLAHIPEVRATGNHRAIIIMGDIDNSTGIVPSSEFELLRSRLRSQLLQSNHVTQQVRFVERRARMSQLAQRERVASEGYYADPEDYDPAITFTLNGDFKSMHRGGTNLYYMEFHLVHFATNNLVHSVSYDLKQGP